MNRRNFIQQLIYTIIALFFGPEALAELDLVESERFIDKLARELPVMSDQSMVYMSLRVFQWFKTNPPRAWGDPLYLPDEEPDRLLRASGD